MHRNTSAISLVLLLVAAPLVAQQTSTALPAAPLLRAMAQLPPLPQSTPTNTPADESLTRQQAEQLALKNNPRISVATLLSLAQKQVVRETRSALLPDANGNLTAVGANEASRISTGSLAASRLLYHVGAGVELNQLITDFGHTRNLVASSSLQAKASEQQAEATREDIVLATDISFYNALEAQATLQVAKSTVAARQTVADQVDALTASKLKSTLDQSFAQVNLSQAKLLTLDAQSQFDSAMASLHEVLGTTDNRYYQLIDDPDLPQPSAPSVDDLITLALQQRPDLLALKDLHEADLRYARAQRQQLLPTVSGLGVVGETPVGASQYFSSNWYGAAGVNVAIPIFNGFKFHAEASEADFRAKASDQQSRVLINRIVRDVRTAWLQATTARQRMAVTAEFVKEANIALDLADTRYRLGLSSIVELSQAQLQQTQAQIDDANARFAYEADLAALRFQSGIQP